MSLTGGSSNACVCHDITTHRALQHPLHQGHVFKAGLTPVPLGVLLCSDLRPASSLTLSVSCSFPLWGCFFHGWVSNSNTCRALNGNIQTQSELSSRGSRATNLAASSGETVGMVGTEANQRPHLSVLPRGNVCELRLRETEIIGRSSIFKFWWVNKQTNTQNKTKPPVASLWVESVFPLRDICPNLLSKTSLHLPDSFPSSRVGSGPKTTHASWVSPDSRPANHQHSYPVPWTPGPVCGFICPSFHTLVHFTSLTVI